MERIYRYSILLIAFIVPTPFSGLTLAALSVVFICWLRAGDYKNVPKVIKQPQVLFPLAFYLFIAAGLLYTTHPNKALSGLSTQISFALFPLILGSSSIIDRKQVKNSLRVSTISICVFLLIAIAYALIDTITTGEHTIMVGEAVYSKFRSFGLTSVFRNWHPTYVALFANLGIAALLQNCLLNHRKRQILFTITVVLFLSICLVLLNSLIGLSCLVLLVLYYINQFANFLRVGNRIKAVVFITILASICSIIYFNPIRNEKIDSLKNKAFVITDRQDQRNLLTMRLAKWQTHYKIFKQHWLGGTTFGDINFVRKETYEKEGYKDLANYNYNAHNQYLEVLATYGIIGGLLFLGLLITPLFDFNKEGMFIPFLLIAAVTFFTESILVRQQGILFFMFFYSLLTRHRKV